MYGGSNFSKKIQFNAQGIYRIGHFDLDFGNGRKYPRVSPAALLLGQDAPLDPGRGNLLQFTGAITYQPTNELRTSFSLTKQKLTRHDTGLVAFDINILNARATYQFSKATLHALFLTTTHSAHGAYAALLGYTPSPGTSSTGLQR